MVLPGMTRVYDDARQIGILFAGQDDQGEDDCVMLCVNTHWEAHGQELPEPPEGRQWRMVFHTGCEDPFFPDTEIAGGHFVIGARAVAALECV